MVVQFNHRLGTFLNGYVQAMLWCNTMEYRGEELTTIDATDFIDATEFTDDLTPELLAHVEETCKDFVESFDRPDIDRELRQEWLRFLNCYANLPHAGSMFALSRNGHGAGFFDCGEGFPRLQEWAKAWGSETWLLNNGKVELLG